MAGVTHNAGCFVGEAGSVDVQEGGERDTDDPTSSLALQGLAVGSSAAPKPHSDAAGQEGLDGASVEGTHDGRGGLVLSSACGGSRGSVGTSWPVMWCWLSRRDPH